MSKSKGNVIDPWTVLDTRGADALRWNFFSAGSPWTPRRVSVEAIDESARFLVTLWNTYSFFVTYANLDGWTPGAEHGAATPPTHVLDRWVRSRLHHTVAAVTDALDGFDALRGAQALDAFVDDLSNWYVRRSRARFWNANDAHAHATLHECLSTLALLLAPFTPFVADELHRNLRRLRARTARERRVGAPRRLARGRRRRARRRARGRDGAGARGRVARPVGPQRGQAQGAPAAATGAGAAARRRRVLRRRSRPRSPTRST